MLFRSREGIESAGIHIPYAVLRREIEENPFKAFPAVRQAGGGDGGGGPLGKRAARDRSICSFEILFDRTNGVRERE